VVITSEGDSAVRLPVPGAAPVGGAVSAPSGPQSSASITRPQAGVSQPIGQAPRANPTTVAAAAPVVAQPAAGGYGTQQYPQQAYTQAAYAAPVQAPTTVKCQGLYRFDGQDATELSFNAGDIITVLRQGGDWWEGEINGRRGLFPSNYVRLC